MRRLRLSGRQLLSLAVAVVLVGAGYLVLRETVVEDPFADYCAEVDERQAEIGAAVAAGPETGLIRALPSFRELAAKAPEDIRDEWDTVITAIEALVEAFDEADADPTTYDRKKPPADVSKADRAAIEAAAIGLGSQRTQAALAGVDQQARDVCKTPLSL